LETSSLNYHFGEFTLNITKGCVLKAGEEIKLRPKVYETLKYLVEHSGRLIGKQELMQAVWPDAFVTDEFAGAMYPRAKSRTGGSQSAVAQDCASARVPL